MKKYQTTEKILTPESERRFNAIFVTWVVLGYGLGIVVDESDVRFADCGLCEAIGTQIPSIHRMAIGSRYAEAMHYVWLYSLITAPVLLVALFVFVRDFNRIKQPLVGMLVLAVLGLLGAYVYIVGMDFGGMGEGGRFSQLYYRYLLCSSLFACACSGTAATAVFHLVHHIVDAIGKASLIGRS